MARSSAVASHQPQQHRHQHPHHRGVEEALIVFKMMCLGEQFSFLIADNSRTDYLIYR